MSEIRIGAHVEQDDPLAEAAARQAPLVQFFLGDPQGYKGPEVKPGTRLRCERCKGPVFLEDASATAPMRPARKTAAKGRSGSKAA